MMSCFGLITQTHFSHYNVHSSNQLQGGEGATEEEEEEDVLPFHMHTIPLGEGEQDVSQSDQGLKRR